MVRWFGITQQKKHEESGAAAFFLVRFWAISGPVLRHRVKVRVWVRVRVRGWIGSMPVP